MTPVERRRATAAPACLDEVRWAIDAIRYSRTDQRSDDRAVIMEPVAETPVNRTWQPNRVELSEIIQIRGRVPRAFLEWFRRVVGSSEQERQMLRRCDFKEE